MVILGDITEAQQIILKEICFKQLSSLRRLYNESPASNKKLAKMLEKDDCTPFEFKQQLLKDIKLFRSVGSDPTKIVKLENSEFKIMKHILNVIESKYMDTYPNAVRNLWSRLNIVNNFKTFNAN